MKSPASFANRELFSFLLMNRIYLLFVGVAAVISNACSRKDIVNVQGDSGLQTAYLIAHETGHK